MLGRGIDQILPHPSDPHIYESYMDSALGYVALAEAVNGPIERPADYGYVWGDALAVLEREQPDLRIINLETSVTRSEEIDPKGINYRMNPANVPCLTAAEIDCCVLANNHVLDWGSAGLLETLAVLKAAGIDSVGAGATIADAAAPMILAVAEKGRVIIFAFGATTSGIPRDWAARGDEPGVNVLPDLSDRTVRAVSQQVSAIRQPGDIVIASIHWGDNWGYHIGHAERRFAHALIEQAGVDIIHGHSSHHAKGIEVHNGRPIFYGCGDFLNDYEGITGYEEFRDDLALMYFVTVDPTTGRLVRLEITPLQIRKFKLNHSSAADVGWVRQTLNREGATVGTRVELGAENTLELVWR